MTKIGNFNRIIIANWKLNGSPAFVENYLKKIDFNASADRENCIIICPPFPFINLISFKNIFIGGQNCSIYYKGSYTGEISARMLKDSGCQFCIIGHSERRVIFNENYEMISKKILNCIVEEIVPILCIGENLQEKNDNLTKEILVEQIKKCIPKEANNNNIIVAYEPLWAIGSGITPSLQEISEIHLFIKKNVFHDFNYKILYGGSVKASNSNDILNLEGVDGLLVGGSSINIDEFNKIIKL